MPTPDDEEAIRLRRLTYAKYPLHSANVSLRSPSPLVARPMRLFLDMVDH